MTKEIRQCPSCGGFCKKSGCERENITPPAAQPAQEPDRQTLQANGTHPAPCARHCEATAFNIVIRNLKAQLAQPVQEPVSYQCKGIPRKGCNYLTACDRVCNKCGEIHHHHQMVANFTFPPQRPWVGLTREESLSILDDCRTPITYISMIEAKLKEKNS